MYNIEELRIRLLSELKEIAEELGVKNSKNLKKDELVYAILDQQAIIPEQALPKIKPTLQHLPQPLPKSPQNSSPNSEDRTSLKSQRLLPPPLQMKRKPNQERKEHQNLMLSLLRNLPLDLSGDRKANLPKSLNPSSPVDAYLTKIHRLQVLKKIAEKEQYLPFKKKEIRTE
jgi:transcription termination factor Rho